MPLNYIYMCVPKSQSRSTHLNKWAAAQKFRKKHTHFHTGPMRMTMIATYGQEFSNPTLQRNGATLQLFSPGWRGFQLNRKTA